MVYTLIDLLNNIIKFNDTEIILLLDNDKNPWFSGLSIAKMLEYTEPKKAIQNHVKQKYKKRLDELIDDPSDIGKNIKPQSIFINESGLYTLIMKSRQTVAIEFKEWIVEEAIPQIRKTGQYKIVEKYAKELEDVNIKLNEVAERNKTLEHNQKKEIYPKGGVIYIIKPSNEVDDLYKIGKSDDIKNRIPTYNTGVPDNVQVLFTLKVENPIAVEHCLKSLLYEYRYRNNKEYYKCPINKITNVIAKCDKIVKGEYHCDKCDKVIDEKDLSRHVADDILIDGDKDIIIGIYTEIDNEYQEGGALDEKYINEYKYLKYKSKYLTLLIEKELLYAK